MQGLGFALAMFALFAVALILALSCLIVAVVLHKLSQPLIAFRFYGASVGFVAVAIFLYVGGYA